jgi:hypothetical protein
MIQCPSRPPTVEDEHDGKGHGAYSVDTEKRKAAKGTCILAAWLCLPLPDAATAGSRGSKGNADRMERPAAAQKALKAGAVVLGGGQGRQPGGGEGRGGDQIRWRRRRRRWDKQQASSVSGRRHVKAPGGWWGWWGWQRPRDLEGGQVWEGGGLVRWLICCFFLSTFREPRHLPTADESYSNFRRLARADVNYLIFVSFYLSRRSLLRLIKISVFLIVQRIFPAAPAHRAPEPHIMPLIGMLPSVSLQVRPPHPRGVASLASLTTASPTRSSDFTQDFK